MAAARRSITASASGSWRPMMAGTPGFRMPAFSAAMAARVSPRYASWSIETAVMQDEARLLDDVGGVEPPAQARLQQQPVGRHRRRRRGRRRRW